jgi:S-adenosylmethionine uptake transporter
MLFSAIPGIYHWTTPDIGGLALLFILGAGSNLILYCLLKSFSYIEVSIVAPYRYLELLFSITLGYIFFKEQFNTTNWIGAGIIVLSTLIMSYEYLLARRLKRSIKSY